MKVRVDPTSNTSQYISIVLGFGPKQWGREMKQTNLFIFYVKDQEASRDFYREVFQSEPTLDVPGMTEFALNDDKSTLLGLMPERGIENLLGSNLPDLRAASGIPRAELYLSREDAEETHARALTAGAREISPPAARNWGELVGYSMDPDGHMLAFGKPL